MLLTVKKYLRVKPIDIFSRNKEKCIQNFFVIIMLREGIEQHLPIVFALFA